nr:E3 ubiquitin-protein ligase CIP8-like [Ipomoea batatas]GMD43489.1 E3 ubiquitin-protein ligase CIP8-like [Ipomoea batatas]
MECDTSIDDVYCAAWGAPYLRTPELVSPSSSSPTHQHFYIRIVLEFLYPSALAVGVTKTEHFWAPCNRLDPEKLSPDAISGMLSDMGVPVGRQFFLLQKISACANEVAGAAHNKGENILPIIVSASVLLD